MAGMGTQREALERAIETLGGITKMALAIGVNSHAVIDQWRRNRVPAEHCPTIERSTRERAAESGDASLVVTCEELRPDIEWSVLREQAV